MDPLLIAAPITAFFAGIAALFAPCCIGVLLPAYLGSIFRQKRTIFLMTGVFFLGLLAVFVPLGLGIGALGELLKQYHDAIYITASIFLFLLGVSLLLGLHFSIPFSPKSRVRVTGATSVFALGIFSGLATLCCAPVLAGALALSFLPGHILWGALYSAIYALGMVSPLFIISYFIDKTNVMEKVNFFKKDIAYRLFDRTVTISVSQLISGIVFILMAIVIVYSLITSQISMKSTAQLQVNILMAQITDVVTALAAHLWFQLLLLVILLGVIAYVVVRALQRRKITR